MIHRTHVRCSSQNQIAPEHVRPLACSLHVTVCLIFSNDQLLSFNYSIYKCHTSAFNALINSMQLRAVQPRDPTLLLDQKDFMDLRIRDYLIGTIHL